MLSPVLTIYSNMLPLFLMVLLGFFLQKKLGLDEKTLAKLLIYILSPIIAIGSLSKLDVSAGDFSMALIIFIIGNFFGFGCKFLGPKYFSKPNTSLISFALSVPNSGFFGISAVLAILGEKALPFQVLVAYFGVGITNYTTALYFLASGSMSPKDSIKKLFSMPFLYAVAIGLTLSYFDITLPKTFDVIYERAKHGFLLIAMLTMGIVCTRINLKNVNYRVVSTVVLNKFVSWPVIIFSIIYFDTMFTHIFSDDAKYILFCNSLVPIGMNTVNLSIILGLEAGMAALLLAITTILSFILLPLGFMLMGMLI